MNPNLPEHAVDRPAVQRPLVLSFLVLLALCVFLESRGWVVPSWGSHDIGRDAIRAESGAAYTTPLSFASPALEVLEGANGTWRRLGPGGQPHDAIRQHGGGRYSLWNGTLYFSASDNSDPRTNGRTYRVEADVQLPDLLRAGSWLLCAALAGVLIGGLGRARPRAATIAWLLLLGAVLARLGLHFVGSFRAVGGTTTFGTAWLPYSDALGPWLDGGLAFLLDLEPAKFLYRPTVGAFWGSLLNVFDGQVQAVPMFFCAALLAFLAAFLSTGREDTGRKAMIMGVGACVLCFEGAWGQLLVSSLGVDLPSLVLSLAGVLLVLSGGAGSGRAALFVGCACLGLAAVIRGPFLLAGPVLIAGRILTTERMRVRDMATCALCFAAPVIIDARLQGYFGIVSNGLPGLFCVYTHPSHAWNQECHDLFHQRRPPASEVLLSTLAFLVSAEGRAWLWQAVSARMAIDFKLLAAMPPLGLLLGAGAAVAMGDATASPRMRVQRLLRVVALVGSIALAYQASTRLGAVAWITLALVAAVALRSWRAALCLAMYVAGTVFLGSIGVLVQGRYQHTFSFTLFLGAAFLAVETRERPDAAGRPAAWLVPACVGATLVFLYLGYKLPSGLRDTFQQQVEKQRGVAFKVAGDARLDRSLWLLGDHSYIYTRFDTQPPGALRRFRALARPERANESFDPPNAFVD